jgi:class 3 adenylate cyclase/GAF domain-containing protein
MVKRLKNLSSVESKLALRDFQLTLLKQISELSIMPVDIDRLLNLMMNLVLQMMQVESGSIILMDHNTGNLVFRVAHGPKAEAIKQFQMKPGEGIVGWVVKTGELLLVNDVTKDSRWYSDLSLKIDYKTSDILCVPLHVKNKTLGALELINRYREYPFTQEDLEVATVLANNLSIVLENFNLFEIADRKISELNSISEVTKNINSVLEIDPLLNVIMDLATDIMKAEASSVLLLDKESRELVFRLALGDKGQQVKQITLKLDEGVAGWVACRGEPLIINDVTDDPRFNPDVDKRTGFKTRAIICVPLKLKDELIGVIEVINRRDGKPFNQDDLNLLSIFADHAAISIDKAHLHENIKHQECIKASYERYFSPQIVNEILNTASGVHLGGQRREVSIIFTDLRDFSGFAEHHKPEEVVDYLNEIFKELVDIIFQYQGTLDKFLGDGLMAIFGAPLYQPDHAHRAICAALKMQEQIRFINARRQAYGQEVLDMGIGINTGEAIVGNIGSEKRMEYTAIGSVINLAFHLQEISRSGYQVLVTENTYRCLEKIPPDLEFKKHVNEKIPYGLSPYYEIIPRMV